MKPHYLAGQFFSNRNHQLTNPEKWRIYLEVKNRYTNLKPNCTLGYNIVPNLVLNFLKILIFLFEKWSVFGKGFFLENRIG